MPLEVILEDRKRSIGAHTVNRVLPQIARRAVGPFVFLDRMGPVDIAPGQSFDVLPHPHIGLSTLSYLFDGAMVHRDSLGSHQLLGPGGVNFMTAASGIVHSERGPEGHREHALRMHGLQFWVALPLSDEDGPPSFQHVSAEAVPVRNTDGCSLRIVAGEAYGAVSPLRTASPCTLVVATLSAGATLTLPELAEAGVYVVDGTIESEHNVRGPSHLFVFGRGTSTIVAKTASLVAIFGGPPLDAPRHLYWNFVASSKDRLERAKADWRSRSSRFAAIPGDDAEFIPLPEP